MLYFTCRCLDWDFSTHGTTRQRDSTTFLSLCKDCSGCFCLIWMNLIGIIVDKSDNWFIQFEHIRLSVSPCRTADSDVLRCGLRINKNAVSLLDKWLNNHQNCLSVFLRLIIQEMTGWEDHRFELRDIGAVWDIRTTSMHQSFSFFCFLHLLTAAVCYLMWQTCWIWSNPFALCYLVRLQSVRGG